MNSCLVETGWMALSGVAITLAALGRVLASIWPLARPVRTRPAAGQDAAAAAALEAAGDEQRDPIRQRQALCPGAAST